MRLEGGRWFRALCDRAKKWVCCFLPGNNVAVIDLGFQVRAKKIWLLCWISLLSCHRRFTLIQQPPILLGRGFRWEKLAP